MSSNRAPIPVLFQDESIIGVDKPAGLLVHRSRESSDRVFLLQVLRDQTGRHVFPIHRLDRPVSGAMVLAFSGEIASGLQESLSSDETLKEYLTLARGTTPDAGVIDRPLTGENGQKQEALTYYRTLHRFEEPGCSLIQVRIKTGRRHQIRRHFAFLGHQLVGDTKHGKGWLNQMYRDKYGFHRIFLHCSRLAFTHPVTQNPVDLRAPLPAEIESLLKQLPGYDPSILQKGETPWTS